MKKNPENNGKYLTITVIPWTQNSNSFWLIQNIVCYDDSWVNSIKLHWNHNKYLQNKTHLKHYVGYREKLLKKLPN